MPSPPEGAGDVHALELVVAAPLDDVDRDRRLRGQVSPVFAPVRRETEIVSSPLGVSLAHRPLRRRWFAGFVEGDAATAQAAVECDLVEVVPGGGTSPCRSAWC